VHTDDQIITLFLMVQRRAHAQHYCEDQGNAFSTMKRRKITAATKWCTPSRTTMEYTKRCCWFVRIKK